MTQINHLFTLSISNVIKLYSKNYLDWKLQIKVILNGHDLMGYIDGSCPQPAVMISENNTEKSNPAFTAWFRQDQLIFGALVGTLLPNLISLISHSKTSKELWDKLAETFNKISRGQIKQKKDQLKAISKGSSSITEYMHSIKSIADDLASMAKPRQ